MSDNPIQLIVAAFQDEQGAKVALHDLKQAHRAGLIKIENAAVLSKDAKGKLHIKETHDMGGGKGAAIGGVAGAAIGVLAGPALVVPAAVGALVGGLTAKLRDTGFPDERLQRVGAGLKPGSSAIVAVVEHQWVERVKKEMAEEGADILAESLGADIASQLEAGHDVAYTAVATQSGFMAARSAGNEEEAEGGTIIIDDSGVYGGRYVATREGFAVEDFVLTEEGMIDEVVVAISEETTYASAMDPPEDGDQPEEME
ncbi:MAG: DUF1269 domain-containing protein [Anaerolineae bacterium]